MTIQITDLSSDNQNAIRQAAELLVVGFREHWPNAWPDMEDALEEISDLLQPGRICRIAVDENSTVVGLIGGRNAGYDDNVWELHPLVVHPNYQGQGIGRRLVDDLEHLVRERGALTMMLGTDDEDNMTTLAGVDLYQNTWDHIRHIQNLKNHPYSFYQKMGYTIIGVLPDANGPGKPDIYMAKRLR